VAPKIKSRAFLPNRPLFKELAPREIDRIAAGSTELHLSRRLHALISDVAALSLQSGTRRVIGYLLRQGAMDTCEFG
jgi:hypothetical protein